MRLTIQEDCNNAPKREYIRDFNIAFAESKIEKILSMMSDDAVWTLVGNKTISGKDAIKKELEPMNLSPATELEINNILTHGKQGAANGVMRFADSAMAFCDIYIFSSHTKDAKIKELISYGIDLKE